ncbi:hypothetical protein Bca4012_072814 [Brassica carinata]
MTEAEILNPPPCSNWKKASFTLHAHPPETNPSSITCSLLPYVSTVSLLL